MSDFSLGPAPSNSAPSALQEKVPYRTNPVISETPEPLLYPAGTKCSYQSILGKQKVMYHLPLLDDDGLTAADPRLSAPVGLRVDRYTDVECHLQMKINLQEL